MRGGGGRVIGLHEPDEMSMVVVVIGGFLSSDMMRVMVER